MRGIRINKNTFRHILPLSVVGILIIVSGLCFHADMVCEAKMGGKKTDEPEAGAAGTSGVAQDEIEAVEAFMTAFYEAQSKDGLASLQDYIEDEEELHKNIIRYETMFAYGFQKYDNIDVDAYSLSQDGYWFVCVYSDMVVADSDIRLPGARGYLVHRGEDKKLHIILDDSGSGTPDEVYEKLQEEMHQIILMDEAYDKMRECNDKFNEICEENPEVMEWVYDVSVAADRAVAEAISADAAEKDITDGKADSGNAEHKVYIVQKGDCLWDIAEEQLGNGMYWSRIYEKNKSVIGDDPDLLFVGIQLKLSE